MSPGIFRKTSLDFYRNILIESSKQTYVKAHHFHVNFIHFLYEENSLFKNRRFSKTGLLIMKMKKIYLNLPLMLIRRSPPLGCKVGYFAKPI